MSLWTWANSRIRKFHVLDVQLFKLSVAAFVLMIAKLWSALLSLDWYRYTLITLLAGIKPLAKMFAK